MWTRLLLLAMTGLLTACNIPLERELATLESNSTPVAQSLNEALKHSTPVALQLDSKRAHKALIDADTPRLLIDNIPSNYRTFSIELNAGDPYSLHVISDCISCAGHARYGVKPMLYLLDDQGNLVNDRPSDAYSGTHGATLRLTGYAPHSGTFVLVVVADNRELGREISLEQDTRNADQAILQKRLPMRSYPIGAIRVFANTRS